MLEQSKTRLFPVGIAISEQLRCQESKPYGLNVDVRPAGKSGATHRRIVTVPLQVSTPHEGCAYPMREARHMAHDQIPDIDLAAQPSGDGCAECLAGYGHSGCCDPSPSQHVSRHAREAGHPFVTSFEPAEPSTRSSRPQLMPRPHTRPPSRHRSAGKGAADWRRHVH